MFPINKEFITSEELRERACPEKIALRDALKAKADVLLFGRRR